MSTSTPIQRLIAVLDVVDDLPGASEVRERTYELLAAAPGDCVVDVGCGTGRAVGEMHQRGVRAVGVDIDDTMLAVARERWPASPFRLADAPHLPLADGEAQGYRADKLYHALDDPGRALLEARRVLTPGGRIVLAGQDWDTLVIDSDQPELTRLLVAARADTVASPRVARAYRTLLLDHGFADVSVEVHTGIFTDSRMLPLVSGLADAAVAGGVLTRAEVDGWVGEQTERARSGRFLLVVPLFVAAGTRR
ncbi:methyltransferase domain-containing protein [Pseudonocardia alaniniphila]|uniref:Methyltransferase domain-containing protein n=1 Tax=Pseudonocardia alaniniphila TaxID=75291 RepID=A0ABS9T9C4_9PSEU|nr:methyltransferase domain-containing protein [Pseudonocardia alaniniphila]MCH6165023.1 methyltransferase domain-containing protein [Pseudonocardia alaniniphila]